MNRLRTKLGLLAAAIAILAAPAAASAEYLVPPGNSAVTQYTESFPTAGGDKNSEKVGEGDRSPEKTLGKRNAERLEAQGEDGVVVAEVAAETAPASSAPAPAPTSTPEDEGKQPGKAAQAGKAETDVAPAVPSGSGGPGDPGPDGSSGLGEVLGQATGTSSGQMGLLLPLALLATLAWALAFLRRQRSRPTT